MTQVRTVEKNQKLGVPHKEKESDVKPSNALPLQIHEAPDDNEETPDEGEIMVEEYAPFIEMIEEDYDVHEDMIGKEEIEIQEHIDAPLPKKTKPTLSSIGPPEAITFTHYELAQYKENDQNVISLNIAPMTMEREKGYEFDVSFMRHSDPSSVYKCKYCVKAFSNAEFLLKHTTSSHICLICCSFLENYNALNTHSKKHKTVTCHFCNKFCSSASNFRQHLKKIHSLCLPSHVGVIANEYLK